MANNPEAIAQALERLVRPQARARLLALGLARGMVWRNGVVPEGGPEFPVSLTADLLHFGYGVLALALELKDASLAGPKAFPTAEAFRVAAEAIESAVRRADADDPDRGRHLVVSAAAFHLAGFAARSFSLLPPRALDANLASPEKSLGFLLRRDLSQLRRHIVGYLQDPQHSDARVSERLLDEGDDFGADDAALIGLGLSYHRALGTADTALLTGDTGIYGDADSAIGAVVASSASIGNIPMWWVATLTRHLLREVWTNSLHVRLPSAPVHDLSPRWDDMRRDLISLLGARHPPLIDLWPSQLEAAARAADRTDDLVIALPTSAGKTRIAELCTLRSLSDGKRAIYVTPLRALSAQVETLLARTFVPLGSTVTSLYGASGATVIDTQTLKSADIVVATPEKLDFALRQDPTVLDDVALVVFDEGHMIGLGSREIRYEVLIQRLLRRQDSDARRIVCLSAMFNPDDTYFQDFGKWLRSDAPGDLLHVRWRPTRQRVATLDWNPTAQNARLSFIEGERPYVPKFLEARPAQWPRQSPFPKNDIEFCLASANAFARDGHSVLIYSPQRSQIEPLVRESLVVHRQGLLDGIQAPPAEALTVALAIGQEWLGPDHPSVKALTIGVGTHHGALPRPFLTAVEDLLNRRHLPVVVASPTLAQGIDLACSVLIFRSLERFDAAAGGRVAISPAEFANVLGRAGRAYVDLDGIAVLPTFKPGRRRAQHRLLETLLDRSRKQRLVSGLVQLVEQVAAHLSRMLSVPANALLEYVLNQHDVWADGRLAATQGDSDDEDESRTLADDLADLDLALFSLIDPLDVSADSLAAVLDEVLKDSLWKRSLAYRVEAAQTLSRQILMSRAAWLWTRTTPSQRKACFYAGLGQSAGIFLYDKLTELAPSLQALNAAVLQDDAEAAGTAAVSFAEQVLSHPFFAVRNLPHDWREILKAWISGKAFAEILAGRTKKEMQDVQTFVQDGVVFRLVWAAEAVRVEATSTGHVVAPLLGDGPAFALTYGVPSIPAALLCQIGFASRVGAVWAKRQLAATFADMAGLRLWIRANGAKLSKLDFWATETQWLLWTRRSASGSSDYPRPWQRSEHVVDVTWDEDPPAPNTPVRLLPDEGHKVSVHSIDLTPLGTARLPFSPSPGALAGTVLTETEIRVDHFGPR